MSDSQNKKNEQQNNLCATLTEQWKKGELKAGMYYIKFKGSGKLDWWHGWYWEDSWSEYVEEVLAPVPSYEEWQELNKQRNQFIRDIKDLAHIQEENRQLKELLYSLKCCLTSQNIEPQMRIEKSLAKIDNVIGEKK